MKYKKRKRQGMRRGYKNKREWLVSNGGLKKTTHYNVQYVII